MSRKTKLELTWVGKENRPRLEPRVLIDVPELSHAAAAADGSAGIVDNLLVQGDNLLALKALEAEYAGRVKCVFIDPPYNTGSAFEHYDDGLEHSIWLSMMRDRLENLRNLLAEDGSIWITLDDNEVHYLKVMLDEIFGRSNFIGSFIWQKRKGGGNDSFFMATDHDYLLVYAKLKDKRFHKPWRVKYDGDYLKRYKEIDELGNRFYWDTLARDGLQNPILVELDCPDGTKLKINSQKSLSTILEGIKEGTVRLVETKNGWSLHHRVMMPDGKVARSILDVGTNKNSSDEISSLFGNGAGFDYAKPETLIKVVLELATNPGDLVLDSFAGSGTTGAVAHKMGRRWIMVEIGDHAQTHIVPRLRKVIDGADAGGVTAATGWQGGGGFRFCRLAPSLITRDKWGREVISAAYDGPLLAQALCKIKGFRYAPSDTDWWIQGKSSDSDFLHVTTQTLSHEQLSELSELVGEGRSLLILCAAWRGDERAFANLTVSKIPDDVLKQCDFGREDYGLPITGDAQ